MIALASLASCRPEIGVLLRVVIDHCFFYCERDKGTIKGRLYNWEGTTAMGRQNLGTRVVESLLSICVSSLSLINAQRTVAVPIRG